MDEGVESAPEEEESGVGAEFWAGGVAGMSAFVAWVPCGWI